MKLQEYLVAIKECSDDKLTNEYGIYDNYHIEMERDYELVAEELKQRKGCIFRKCEQITETRKDYRFTFGIIGIIVNSHDKGSYASFHCLHEFRKETTIKLRDISDAVIDFSNYIIENNIPSVFPNSAGWEHSNNKERIIEYP